MGSRRTGVAGAFLGCISAREVVYAPKPGPATARAPDQAGLKHLFDPHSHISKSFLDQVIAEVKNAWNPSSRSRRLYFQHASTT